MHTVVPVKYLLENWKDNEYSKDKQLKDFKSNVI